LLLLNLGREPYQRAWELQHALVQARQNGRVDDTLVLVEHEAVITLGRGGDEKHILATPEKLAELGIRVQRIERGGDVTYHGPGQLMGYPILLLDGYHLGVSDYMHALENVLVCTLRDLGLQASCRAGIIGVWVGGAKIAALGARVERGVTYHGFALNVNTNLEHFSLIVPCGLVGTSVTSMQRELNRPVGMSLVRERVAHSFSQVFGVSLEETTIAALPV
jgi:lipoate-protein ligase B